MFDPRFRLFGQPDYAWTRSNDHSVVNTDNTFLFEEFFQNSISTRRCFVCTSGKNELIDTSTCHVRVAVTSQVVVI